jgi:aminopeptidase-like protein
MRTPFGCYPQYHTSADNLDFIRPDSLADSYAKLCEILQVLDLNRRYINQSPKGEPQLGKRGLYSAVGGENDSKAFQLALLWVLNLSDGAHSLLDIAERAQTPLPIMARAAAALVNADLLREA